MRNEFLLAVAVAIGYLLCGLWGYVPMRDDCVEGRVFYVNEAAYRCQREEG